MLENQAGNDSTPPELQAAALASTPKRRSALDLPKLAARILIVDDDPDILEVLTASMRMEGYQVQATTDSLEALHLLDEFSPDVMCIDYMMPKMDGQQLARQIRARRDMLYVPIVMLTAIGQDDVKLASLDSGVDAFLVKPVKRNELRAVIRTMLRMKTAQDNMLAALERVAEVQDELLEVERQRSHYEASRDMIASYSRELASPLSAATEAASRLEQIIQQTPAEVRETGIAYLRELYRALTQAEQALHRMEQGQ
jgi:two-component system alkaline phosphatase synthesis response regulator PhoP